MIRREPSFARCFDTLLFENPFSVTTDGSSVFATQLCFDTTTSTYALPAAASTFRWDVHILDIPMTFAGDGREREVICI